MQMRSFGKLRRDWFLCAHLSPTRKTQGPLRLAIPPFPQGGEGIKIKTKSLVDAAILAPDPHTLNSRFQIPESRAPNPETCVPSPGISKTRVPSLCDLC